MVCGLQKTDATKQLLGAAVASLLSRCDLFYSTSATALIDRNLRHFGRARPKMYNKTAAYVRPKQLHTDANVTHLKP